MIRAILIDDESNSISALRLTIEEHCPEVKIIDQCQSPDVGIESILKYQPDLIFLDVEMPEMNGFELLEKIKHQPVSVIFTTAYHHYAIKAIRYSALDYLVKPIDPIELSESIERFKSKKSTIGNQEQFQFLLDQLLRKDHAIKKVAIPNMEGFKLINIDDIHYCEADDNYTHIHLKNKSKITASRTLKDIQVLFSDYPYFMRIHHSFLINVKEVAQYVRGEGGHVIMNDGTELAVSRNKKEMLVKCLTKNQD